VKFHWSLLEFNISVLKIFAAEIRSVWPKLLFYKTKECSRVIKTLFCFQHGKARSKQMKDDARASLNHLSGWRGRGSFTVLSARITNNRVITYYCLLQWPRPVVVTSIIGIAGSNVARAVEVCLQFSVLQVEALHWAVPAYRCRRWVI